MPAMAVITTIMKNHLLLDLLILSAQAIMDVNFEICFENI